MFLTLLQSRGRPAPVTPSGGGGPGNAAQGRRRRGEGWGREREILEASLARFRAEASQELQDIRDVLDAAPQPQAQRIARKLTDYTGEIAQVESLRRELAKLQIESEAREGLQQDLADAVQSLREILRDEEDAIAAVMALHDHEARHLLGMLGISVH